MNNDIKQQILSALRNEEPYEAELLLEPYDRLSVDDFTEILDAAVYYDSMDIIIFLIENYYIRNNPGFNDAIVTALVTSSQLVSMDIFHILMEYSRISPNYAMDGRPLIIHLIQNATDHTVSYMKAVMTLLKQYRADINILDVDGRSILFYIIDLDDMDLIDKLLQIFILFHGNMYAREPTNGNSVLIELYANNDREILNWLFQHINTEAIRVLMYMTNQQQLTFVNYVYDANDIEMFSVLTNIDPTLNTV